MTKRTFDTGWEDGLADRWTPPTGRSKDREDYKSGWQLARGEVMLQLLREWRERRSHGECQDKSGEG